MATIKAHGLGMPWACPQIKRQLVPQQACSRQPLASVTRRLACRASKEDDLELVKKEEQPDGTVLFVFGSQEEAEEAQGEATTADQPAQAEHSRQPAPEQPLEREPAAAEGDPSPAEAAAESQPKEPSPSPQTADDDAKHTAEGTSAEGDTEAAELASFPFSDGASNNCADSSFSREQLSDMKVVELRELCKENNIKGYSKYKKEELIDVLLGELSS